jgi:hypothetical protein
MIFGWRSHYRRRTHHLYRGDFPLSRLITAGYMYIYIYAEVAPIIQLLVPPLEEGLPQVQKLEPFSKGLLYNLGHIGRENKSKSAISSGVDVTQSHHLRTWSPGRRRPAIRDRKVGSGPCDSMG